MEPRQAISTELVQSQSALSSSLFGEVAPPLCKGTLNILLQHSSKLFYLLSSPWSDLHAGGVLSGLAPAIYFCSSVQVALQFGAVLWERQFSIFYAPAQPLPTQTKMPAAPPDNRAHPLANPSQVPDLEGLHREIYDMAKQMRIMNENNGRLMQLLTAANPQLSAAPPVPDIERSCYSNRSGDRSQNISIERVRRGRRRAPSPSLRERSSSSESSKTPARARRGRSPHRGDQIEARNKSTSQKIRDLDTRLDAINTGTNAPVTVDTLIRQIELPFTERVLRDRISSKFKLPAQLGIYEGKTDPMDHLDSYKSLMSLQGCSDEVMCKAFFRHFERTCQIVVSKTVSRNHGLFWRSHSSTLRRQFHELQESIEECFPPIHRLRPGPLFDSLSKNVPETLSALQSKADKYIAAEELVEAKRRRQGKDDHKRKKPDTRRIDYREETRNKRLDRDSKRSNDRRLGTPPRRPEFILPPLNAPVAQVLSEN
ncbi:hypothetical protein Acr_18g0009640 [Actinidia rufa]|uniref:Uncharacterized protein n=1 Tax=Actinidia rufa TaxID=165716 RepID=A0A7J0G7L5_9ERIC|nr:hypothetical protein Acr_18g0009640 [Actinidia rufa]